MIEEVTKRPSAMVLIIANLLPLVGVLVWKWDVFSIVVLYWMENVVLGVINILKMITCRPDLEKIDFLSIYAGRLKNEQREQVLRELGKKGGLQAAMGGHAALKFFMIPFFTLHYFGFCAGHGFFVFAMFGNKGFPGGGGDVFSSFERLSELFAGAFGLAAIGLLVSHLYSFVANYVGRGEYQRTVVPVLMFKPYGRIIVLHLAIIFGGFVVMSLGSPVGLLLVMIVGKIALDLKMHLREHRDAPPRAAAAASVG